MSSSDSPPIKTASSSTTPVVKDAKSKPGYSTAVTQSTDSSGEHRAGAAGLTPAYPHPPHQPTTAAATQPFINTAMPALNSEPIELDATPVTSPTAEGGAGSSSGGGPRFGGSSMLHDALGKARDKIGQGLHAVTPRQGQDEPDKDAAAAVITSPGDEAPSAEEIQAALEASEKKRP